MHRAVPPAPDTNYSMAAVREWGCKCARPCNCQMIRVSAPRQPKPKLAITAASVASSPLNAGQKSSQVAAVYTGARQTVGSPSGCSRLAAHCGRRPEGDGERNAVYQGDTDDEGNFHGATAINALMPLRARCWVLVLTIWCL